MRIGIIAIVVFEAVHNRRVAPVFALFVWSVAAPVVATVWYDRRL